MLRKVGTWISKWAYRYVDKRILVNFLFFENSLWKFSLEAPNSGASLEVRQSREHGVTISQASPEGEREESSHW